MSWTFHDRMVEKMTKEKAIVHIENALNIPNNNTGLTVIGLETLREALTWADRKRGRWIKKRGEHMNTGEKVTFTVCSECGEMHEPTNYCPSCGAKMSETDS